MEVFILILKMKKLLSILESMQGCKAICLLDYYYRSYGLFTCNGILFNHESTKRWDICNRKITWPVDIHKRTCLECLFRNLDALELGARLRRSHGIFFNKEMTISQLQISKSFVNLLSFVRSIRMGWYLLVEKDIDRVG